MKRVLLVHPCYGGVESESYHAARHSVKRRTDLQVGYYPPKASLLAHAFNLGVCAAINQKFDYFVLLHGDIASDDGWLDIMFDELERKNLDVIHAASPIKDDRGLTSTAIGYCDDEWMPVRRITTTELHRLPETFDIEDIRRHLDPEADRLLPNTGCLLMPATTWFKHFPGFTINDRVINNGEEWGLDVTPEDWNFGHWCARNGLKVGGTRAVRIRHFGRHSFDSSVPWGEETDKHWLEAKANLQGVEI